MQVLAPASSWFEPDKYEGTHRIHWYSTTDEPRISIQESKASKSKHSEEVYDEI